MRASSQDRLSSPDEGAGPTPDRDMQRSAMRGGGIAFSLMALALAVTMAVAVFYILQSVRELSGLETRLSELNQFERRLSSKLDTVNEGMQAQIDRLASNVAGLSGEVGRLRAELQETRRNLRRLAEQIEDGAGMPAALMSGPEGGPAEGEFISVPPDLREEGNSSNISRPSGSPQFRRIETPDGKVTYSKVR